jgi:hypothetical protein
MTATATKTAAKIAAAYGSRPGTKTAPAPEHIPDAGKMVAGLDLSDICYKPRSWFRPNPENEIFRALKSDAYFRDLERDIREAGQIVNPLIALPDGLLLEGESRLIVAERLGIDRLPVRIVLSPMSAEEQRKRLWLGNLSRFEVDEDTRLLLYSRLWPGYFNAPIGATVAPEDSPEAIAESTGKSKRTVINDKHLVQTATAKASAEGREPTRDDLKVAREARNAERRHSGAAPENPVIVKVRRVIAELKTKAETCEEGIESAEAGAYLDAARMIEEALR